MIGKINIFGPIGKYEENGKLEGVSLLDVISQVKALAPETQVIEVHIASPGGLVDDGDNIYNYLDSLKKKCVVNTIQDGNIASIATKLFLVGMQRTADQKFDFMIHNPWVDAGPGDSNHQADVLESLLQAEDNLRKFYSKTLDITEEGLKPLMDQETTLTAQQLISLGFATNIKMAKPVMAMKTEKKGESLLQKAQALVKKIKGSAVQALDLQTVDGKTLSVDAANEDSMEGANAMIDGQPAPDGDYTIAPDDMGMSDVLTVKGGVVTAVTEQPAAQLPQAKEMASKISDLEKTVSQIADAVAALLENAGKTKSEAVNEAVTQALEKADKQAEAKIMAAVTKVKDEIGTVHTPKKSAIYAESVDKTETGFKSISDRMREKAEALKNKRK